MTNVLKVPVSADASLQSYCETEFYVDELTAKTREQQEVYDEANDV
jgi:hypothetical protein